MGCHRRSGAGTETIPPACGPLPCSGVPTRTGVPVRALRLLGALAVAGALALLGAGRSAAQATPNLVESDPADGAELAQPPTQVVLTFDAPIGEASLLSMAC